MFRLLMVRHGRTAWNTEGRVQGGGALDKVGRAQALALAHRLAGEPISAVYASPALRARQTARAAARLLDLPVHQSSLLKDLDYGRYAGALVEDVKRDNPDLFARWRDAPETVTFENGENLGHLRSRLLRFMARTRMTHPGKTVLAATHDSPVRMAASIVLDLPDAAHREDFLKAPLASLTVIEIDEASSRLKVHNSVDHLEGIDGSA